MTGLLHRLAARANGTAWTVRSDSRLPFASESWGQTAIETEAQQTEPSTLLRPAAAAPAPDRQAAETIAQPNRPRQQQATWQVAASEPPDALMPPSTPPRWTVQQHLIAADAATSPQPPGVRTVSPQQTPGAPAIFRPAAAQTHAASAFAQSTPEPLLPPVSANLVAASAGLAPRAQLGAWASTAQPAAREDTEVHIHIGRIDVTAVHEGPKPRPRTRERTQPVSLDTYLAARHTK